MIKTNHRIVIAFALAITLILPSCKKKDDDNSGTVPASSLIRKVSTIEITGQEDTATIEYNTDQTVHRISHLVAFNGVSTFYYTPGLVRRITTYPNSNQVTTDSMIMGSNGMPAVICHMDNTAAEYNTIEQHSYNADGTQMRTIITYPNLPQIQVDTLTYTWVDGDLLKEHHANDNFDVTFTYNTAFPCMSGDELYVEHLLATGRSGLPCKHLCTSCSIGGNDVLTYTYSYDASNRIAGYVIHEDGEGDKNVYYSYD